MKRYKIVYYIFLVLLSIVLMGNTNNNSTPFSERMFPPIHTEFTTFHYSGFIILFLMYYGFKGLLSLKKHITNIRIKAIILAVLIPLLMTQLWEDGIKIYKSSYHNLNAIYSYYEENSISYRSEDNGAYITGTIHLENLSDEKQDFFIKITLPSYWDDSIVDKELFALEEDLESKKSFTLYPKQEKVIEFVLNGSLLIENTSVSGSTHLFEYTLIHGKEEVNFVGDRSF
ncbi:hypothetical protein [Chengkuizengella sediminis]|uniref:hypothetical protein n=1 Tax=Chengkuizengella sediminis TaxID=1885917 RepID=UPI0013899C00|nr:hypothetical protein [Chengkuizengella sediminis]NDI33938.1 hypothetical protein [Chengkuizengella sediminis]